MMRAAAILVAALLAVIVRSETPDHVTSKLRIRVSLHNHNSLCRMHS